jgi:hypothetical protein
VNCFLVDRRHKRNSHVVTLAIASDATEPG